MQPHIFRPSAVPESVRDAGTEEAGDQIHKVEPYLYSSHFKGLTINYRAPPNKIHSGVPVMLIEYRGVGTHGSISPPKFCPIIEIGDSYTAELRRLIRLCTYLRILFLTAILHRGLRIFFLFSFYNSFTFSNFYLDIYFPFSYLDFYIPFLFELLRFRQFSDSTNFQIFVFYLACSF